MKNIRKCPHCGKRQQAMNEFKKGKPIRAIWKCHNCDIIDPRNDLLSIAKRKKLKRFFKNKMAELDSANHQFLYDISFEFNNLMEEL